MIEQLHALALIVLMIILAIAIVRMTDLLGIAILTGVYSLLLALVYTILHAVDVAFTEAAVGAGITLTLMLTALSLTSRHEVRSRFRAHIHLPALVIVVLAGGALLLATFEMPDTGDPTAPSHTHLGSRYVAEGPVDTGVPNMVTAVLASYRGFDTLGEVAVIFTAGVCVLALMRRWKRDQA